MSDLKVDKHKNMLILGKAATKYGLKEIIYSDDYDEVLKHYGKSDLSDAFYAAKKIGAPHIFLMNIQKDQDYFEIVETLKQNDFAYVVFCSLLMSDTFIDTYSGGATRSYLAYLMGSIGRGNNSIYVISDKHASLYEDIDAFMNDMNAVQKKFLKYCTARADLQNLIFVANNLNEYKNAAVPLAAALCSTEPKDYPTSPEFGEAIFYINQWDSPEDMVYFRSNTTRETTIENFVNMRQGDYTAQKIVYIDRIIRCIKRDMDFQQIRGKLYTGYQKLQFSRILTEYLNSIRGELIKNYKIDSIEVYRDMPGTVILSARIRIVPNNCLEVVSLSSEVEIS